VAKTFHLGAGDLLVMGGSCQHDWSATRALSNSTISAPRRSRRPRPTRPAFRTPGKPRLTVAAVTAWQGPLRSRHDFVTDTV